jgi:hypothetical protein
MKLNGENLYELSYKPVVGILPHHAADRTHGETRADGRVCSFNPGSRLKQRKN